MNGFKDHDRGKLIMACVHRQNLHRPQNRREKSPESTAGSYISCHLSAYFSRSDARMVDQRGVPTQLYRYLLRYTRRQHQRRCLYSELKIDVTTDPSLIFQALQKTDTDKMTVVFCTYQSLPRIEEAQNNGAPQFDIIFCDEAHRTTGVDRPGDNTSPFVLVHDADRSVLTNASI